jgi:hypothetical protein
MSELNDMGCAGFADVAAELALGVLTGRERAEALAHLDHCEECREHVRQLTMTGEELLGLLPSAEPPPGFETRVMERLGLAVPGPRHAAHRRLSRRGSADTTRPSGRGSADTTRPSGITRLKTGLTGRTRRMLATAAVVLAVIASALGGWGLHAATSSPAGPPLSSAELLSASHQPVGDVFYYHGDSRWMYMSVYMQNANGTVICQLVTTDGNVTTVGSFRLVGGYGSWGGPAAGGGSIAGARLVSPNGTVLASASFSAGSVSQPA